jgi:hypothetical protein
MGGPDGRDHLSQLDRAARCEGRVNGPYAELLLWAATEIKRLRADNAATHEALLRANTRVDDLENT